MGIALSSAYSGSPQSVSYPNMGPSIRFSPSWEQYVGQILAKSRMSRNKFSRGAQGSDADGWLSKLWSLFGYPKY